MAIQIPNLGTGNGSSGENELVIRQKYNANFSDRTNAASRLVGGATGNVPDIGSNFYEHLRKSVSISSLDVGDDLDGLKGMAGLFSSNINTSVVNKPSKDTYDFIETSFVNSGVTWAYGARQKGKIWVRNWGSQSIDPNYSAWGYLYTSANTKLDTNGAISPSSPTIDLYSDRIDTNADGARMNPEFVRNGVGDYTVKNTTGLRENDGWYIKIPNDMNGNPKVAVVVDTDIDGNLSIKTYKRTFSMETFTFIPDLETPLDIPEGRWIDLRFNDLPQENLEDTQPEI